MEEGGRREGAGGGEERKWSNTWGRLGHCRCVPCRNGANLAARSGSKVREQGTEGLVEGAKLLCSSSMVTSQTARVDRAVAQEDGVRLVIPLPILSRVARCTHGIAVTMIPFARESSPGLLWRRPLF